MKNGLLFLIVAILGFFSNSSFACEKPKTVVLPSGESATKREMVEIQDAIRNYVTVMGVYLECIATEVKRNLRAQENLSPQAEQNRLDQLDKKYNAAIDEMEEVLHAHNREAKKFRDKED